MPPWPWSPNPLERSPNPSGPYPMTWMQHYAPLARASCEITNPRTSTTREARRNWIMPRSEEEEATTRRRRLESQNQRQRQGLCRFRSRLRMRIAPIETQQRRPTSWARKNHSACRIFQHRLMSNYHHKCKTEATRPVREGRVPSQEPINSWQVRHPRLLSQRENEQTHNTRVRNRHLRTPGRSPLRN